MKEPDNLANLFWDVLEYREGSWSQESFKYSDI